MKQILLFTLILLLTGCTQSNITGDVVAEPLQLSISLTTDKDLYHSNEMMKISVDVISNKEVSNQTVRVYGINARRNRLDMGKTVNLSEGSNIVEFEFRTPSCNRCSGIKEGVYQINAQTGNISDSKNIEIRQ